MARLTESELIEILLHELPPLESSITGNPQLLNSNDVFQSDMLVENGDDVEQARLLPGQRKVTKNSVTDDEPMSVFVGLNALEIAAIADAKKFLSQRVVQRVVVCNYCVNLLFDLENISIQRKHSWDFCNAHQYSITSYSTRKNFADSGGHLKDDIWNGRIIFWESLNLHGKKKAKLYNKRIDPFSRLRVPKYQKGFEAIFFAVFLVLYYAVLAERNTQKIGFVEILLYIFIAAFAYDKFGEYQDAGSSFYATDFWSLWDIGIIGVGFAYMVSSK